MLKKILISVGILAILISGFFLYQFTYFKGDANGYDRGYDKGYSLGLDKGMATGYDSGYSIGYGEGRTQGVREGRTAIFRELGDSVILQDPTYAEAIAFIQRDQTNKNHYSNPYYVCGHFARDVNNNAEKMGLRCAYVSLRFGRYGHAIVAFNTTDRGLIYFDPQTDEEVSLSDYVDTLTDTLIIW